MRGSRSASRTAARSWRAPIRTPTTWSTPTRGRASSRTSTQALACVRQGGFYVIDDLLPQENWPDGHAAKVDALIADLERRPGFAVVRLAWASGLMLVVRQAPSPR